MQDEIFSESLKDIGRVGVVGAVCILLIALLVYIDRRHRKDLEREQAAHEVTRKQHISDLKELAVLGEGIRTQMQALVVIVQASTELIKDRLRAK